LKEFWCLFPGIAYPKMDFFHLFGSENPLDGGKKKHTAA